MNRKTGLQVVVPSLAIAAGLLIAPATGYSTQQGEERQESRDTKQTGRQDAREAKDECREGDDKSRAECRQEKRGAKQDTRDEARDIKY
jgi:gas vesicle protein